MSILIDRNSKVVVQGITGSEGQFHSEQMVEYGTNIVAGVTPGKGGIKTLNNIIPVFNLVSEAVEQKKLTLLLSLYLLLSQQMQLLSLPLQE